MKKHDLFLVKLKKTFEEVELENLLQEIPDVYHLMFSELWNEFQSLEEMMDEKNFYLCFFISRKFEKDNVIYYHPHRKECLQSILLDKFFDKVIIIQNIYNTKDHNIIIILNNNSRVNINIKNKSDENNSKDPLGINELQFTKDDFSIVANSEDIITFEEWNDNDPYEPEEDITFDYTPTDFKNKKG